MANIPVTGIPSTFIVPGMYAEIIFAQGPSVATGGARSVIYVVPKLSTGEWTVNTVVKVRSENEAITGGGAGSVAHLSAARHFRANRKGNVYFLPYNPTSGSAVNADGYIKFTGTATATGSVTAVVAGESIPLAVSVGDTATVLGDKLVAATNARTHLPVTAANDAGKVTVTAKTPGASQGDGTVGVISLRASKSRAAGITFVVSGAYLGLGAGSTAGVDGSTTELANLQAALDTIASSRYYYIVTALPTAGGLAALKNHIASKSEPDPGLRSVGLSAFSGTLAAAQTLATTLNYERVQLVWQNKPEDHVASIAANVAAVRFKKEELRTRFNFDSYKEADWLVPNTASDADYLDSDDLNDALVDGVTPIQSSPSGSFLVMSTTTRSKDATGLLDDRRALETHRVSVADKIVDTHVARHAAVYSGFNLKDDEKLPNGDVNPNQTRISHVLVPSQYKAWLVDIIREYERQGDLKNVEATIESIEVGIDDGNTSRLVVGYNLDVINLLHQTTVRVAEVSAG
jgi:phage tail sheath gpL-like